MPLMNEAIAELASRYGIQLIYAYGSRSLEVRHLVEGRLESLSSGPSDLDIGIAAGRKLTASQKVDIALQLEDTFGAQRVDLAVINEAPVFLALESRDSFLAQKHNVAAAESYLRTSLEALLGIGRHIPAKGFGYPATEYKEVARGRATKWNV